jgi:energy-coupling factor transport system ATP-binding protein
MDIAIEMNNAGHTIILITHDMRIIAEFTARSVVLRDGVIIMDCPTRNVLVDFTMLRKTQITPPQIIQLSNKLIPEGFPEHALSNEEFMSKYEELLNII